MEWGRRRIVAVFVWLILVVASNGSKSHKYKTIETGDGDVYECVDIRRQPSLQHPSLKGHKVQMSPSLILGKYPLKKQQTESDRVVKSKIGLKESCPLGSIPKLKRASGSLVKPIQKLEPNNSIKPLEDSPQGAFFAGIATKDGHQVTGASGAYAVYNPKLTAPGQRSYAILAVESRMGGSYSRVEAGWMVNPMLYGDDRTRLYTFWTTDEILSTGCFDTNCPGFIHTSTEVPLGYAFPNISVPGEQYFEVLIQIYKGTYGFYLHIGDYYNVGYWPFSIVPSMKDGPLRAKWGGKVFMPDTRTLYPQMGSGPYDYLRRWIFESNAYVENVATYDQNGAYVVPMDDSIQVYMCPCYLVGGVQYRDENDFRYSFVYGGSGGVYGKNCPR